MMKLGINPDAGPPYAGWDFSKGNLAVVASRNGYGSVLWWVGLDIDLQISEYGAHDLGDLGLDDAPDGIHVWQGNYIWSSGVNYEGIDEGGDAEPRGVFRPPTTEEWALIQKNECPWNIEDWKVKDE